MLKSADLSPESLKSVLEHSLDCVKLVSPDGKILWMNPNGLCAMEIDDLRQVGSQEWAMLWPEESRPLIRSALTDAAKGKVSRLEAYCPTAQGSPRWWDVSVSAVRSPDGMAAGFIAVSRDISQAYMDREAQRILLAEMRHRLKNSFAIVCSMLGSMSRGVEAHSAFAEEMIGRISALARAQTLFASEHETTDIGELLDTLVSPFRDCAGALITLDCASTGEISREQADVIALVIGELTVNSTKHGTIGHGGHIDLKAADASGWHVLIWTERCDNPVSQTSRPGGQGLSLIQRICRARGGTFDIEWSDFGLDATLRLPVAA
ncbi:PAS domain-containing protein [Novosphingobium sp. MMS21-SN21R]|uniref:PAS domain-containing protein n=1 Tax=Novosphingobium sp. MMS21-SN21R TaxID=2969298 RepID=UPI002885D489|nr:PAS domain-containing protein [Novosphingobium sp. MMS21-SN21R]MDT0509399.1 PAS domain-containing protein [Novosphingobium sp. MMS21-SN21R]